MKRLLLASMLVSLAALPPACGPQDGENYPVGTRQSMFQKPYLTGSFLHMDRIFPTRPVSRGSSVSRFPRSQERLDLNYVWEGVRYRLADYLARQENIGLLVVKDDRIVYEGYSRGADENSHLTSWSVAKSIVSTLIGFAVSDGLIAVDRPLTDYLPELEATAYDGCTIKDLLQMSSGVGFEELVGTENFGRDIERLWQQTLVSNRQGLNGFIGTLSRVRSPGQVFNYSSADTQVLGWVLVEVTGTSLSAYLSEKLWQPLGMEQDASWVLDGQGMEAAFCCINATLRDWGRFGVLMMNRGEWRGSPLLPATWFDEATLPDRPQVQPGRLFPGYPMGYQYQWWTRPGADDAYVAEGAHGQFLYVNPQARIVMVKMSAWPESWSERKEHETWAVIDAIVERLRDSRGSGPPRH